MPHRFSLLCILLALIFSTAFASVLKFEGLTAEPVVINPESSTGLKEVIVIPFTTGVKAVYTASTPGATVTWQRFSSLGGGYAEDVASTTNGRESSLSKIEGNMGYIITEGSSTTCIWIVDYSTYHLQLKGLTHSPESDCSTTYLNVDATCGDPIRYYSITGVPKILSRDIKLTYRTLSFDESTFSYVESEKTEILESVGNMIHCDAPFCETDFTLSGDRFLEAWGEEVTVTSPIVEPTAVEATTKATQTIREVDNEQRVDATLGGSAPCEIKFESALTDAAVYHRWELSHDADFNLIYLQFTDPEFTHTFRDQGTVYVRLVAANAAGDCEFIGETYDVFIGESDIKCPNAFSPGTTEGVNDEWRVSYKSIVEFDCHIFNRWGQELAHLTDPAQGWNGKSGGKTVGAGVYFYVITARGADGRKYYLRGDINVVKPGRRPAAATTD